MGRLLPAVALLAGLAACSEAGPCPTPLEVCDGGCVDLRSDPRHCGSCDRACAAGLSCSGGECGTSVGSVLGARGGAFVTVEKCGESVKLWITSEAFVARAEAWGKEGRSRGSFSSTSLPAPTATLSGRGTPTERPRPSCPRRQIGTCNVCPSEIERLVSYYVLDVTMWCPSSATVVAVDRQ